MEFSNRKPEIAASGPTRRSLILGAGAVLTLAACSKPGGKSTSATSSVTDPDDLQKLVDLAKKEKEVVIYESPAEAPFTKWVDAFQKKYGITVTATRQTSNAVHARWAQETQAGQNNADVVIHSLPLSFADADKRGWLAKFTPTESAKFLEGTKIESKAYPLFAAVVAMGWNPKVLKPDDIEFIRQNKLNAFRDARFDKLLAVVPPNNGGPQFASYQRIVETQASTYGWKFLEDVAARKPAIFSSGVAMAQRMIAGEYGATFCLSDGIGGSLAVNGAPLEWTYDSNPVGGLFMMGVSAFGPHPNAARLFMQWATTLKAQASLASINQGFVLHKDWVDERPIAKLPWYEGPKVADISMKWAFDPKFTAHQAEISKRWNDVFHYGG